MGSGQKKQNLTYFASFCGLKGMRAPELACGELTCIVEQLSCLQLADVSMRFPSELDVATREQLQQGWLSMVSTLQSGLQMKLGHWLVIPHRLCGLAHSNAELAQLAAVDCLQQWDRAVEHGQHRLSEQFLSHREGSWRQEVEKMANASRLQDLSASFRLAVLRLKFIPTAERRIEEKHARLARRAVTRQYAGAYASLMLRLPEIESHIEQDPHFLTRLLHHIADIRVSPGELLQRLGLSHFFSLVPYVRVVETD